MTQTPKDDVHADPGLGPGYISAAATQAAPVTTSQRPEDRSQEFVAVQGGTETASAGTLLVTAYLVMWALLIGFLFLGFRRSQRLEARLSGLEQALAKHDESSSD